METAIQKIENVQLDRFSAFNSESNFVAAQRMATLLSKSDIVPESYRNNLPNCVIGLEIANRIGASPLAVLQNLYIVHGKPAWSSQFLIACINSSSRFSPIRYVLDGEGDEKGCFAWATDKTGERLESPRVTIGMAKAEGWYGKNGSKWKTMPDLMLRYRAATLFARLYAPEITMGMHTEDEIIDLSPVVTQPAMPPKAAAETVKERFSKAKNVTPELQVEDGPSLVQVQNAIRECGLTPGDILNWFINIGVIQKDQTLKDAPNDWKEKIISDPVAIKSEFSAWLDNVKAE